MFHGEPGQRLALLERFQQQHTGIRTLLFTDLVDSRRLKQELGDGRAVALIQRHHAQVRDCLKGFPDAQEIETAGDSFLVVFARPSDGVRFALGLHTRNRPLSADSQTQVEERIGDHPHIVALREVYFDAPPFDVEMDPVAGQDLRSWCQAQGGVLARCRPDRDLGSAAGGRHQCAGDLCDPAGGPRAADGLD